MQEKYFKKTLKKVSFLSKIRSSRPSLPDSSIPSNTNCANKVHAVNTFLILDKMTWVVVADYQCYNIECLINILGFLPFIRASSNIYSSKLGDSENSEQCLFWEPARRPCCWFGFTYTSNGNWQVDMYLQGWI